MTIAALITWIAAASGGLFMLTIWLIEYERKRDGGAGTRLPAAVLSGHVLLALTGLVLWIGYLYGDNDRLARGALIVLAAVALLGLTMLRRWVSVYRDSTDSLRNAPAQGPGSAPVLVKVPAERHFPLAIVIGHGVAALATITMVLLTVLKVGGGS